MFLLMPLTFLFLVSCSFKNSEDIVISLDKINYNGDLPLNDIVRSGVWEEMDVYGSKIRSVSGDKQFGTVWLMGGFQTTDSPDEYYGLTAREIFQTDEIYINDVLIGKTELDEIAGFDVPRSYVIQENVIRAGKNTVLIHLGFYGKWYGIIPKEILVRKKDSFDRAKNALLFSGTVLPVSVTLLLIGLCIAYLMKFVMNPELKEYLFLFFRVAIGVTGLVSVFLPVQLLEYTSMEKIWLPAVSGLVIFLTLFYQALFKKYYTKANVIGAALIIMATMVFVTVGPGTKIFRAIGTAYLSMLLTWWLFMWIMLLRLFKLTKNLLGAIMTVLDFLILSFTLVFILLFMIFAVSPFDPSGILVWTNLLLAVLFAVYFAADDHRRKKIYQELERRLAKSSKTRREISGGLKSKILKVTEFIERNYQLPVTRHSLAKITDLNLNYFSTAFNEYTGKSLAEYLNGIRIRKAAEKLNDSSLAVTDIAFDTGFQSLTTFNRAFKKEFMITPSEYRKRLAGGVDS